MIEHFKHRGLKRLYFRDDPSGINPEHLAKVRRILASLDAARTIEHMRQPGFRLHELRGDRRGVYAVSVSGNWRVVFSLSAGKTCDVDLIDYH